MQADLFDISIPATGKRHNWANLTGAGIAIALIQAAAKFSGPLVFITDNNANANRFHRELKALMATSDLKVYHFPDWETLPYDNFSPHQDIISDRLLALSKLPSMEKGIVVVPITTLMHRLCPADYVMAHSIVLKVGEKFQLENMRGILTKNGYHHVSQVMTHGEFAIRGSIIDIFPMGSKLPVRIDLFDNEIDTLREFDPISQRSDATIDSFCCLPAREFPLNEQSITLFRQNWRAKFSGDPSNCPIYQSISEGLSCQGIEYYLPLFFNQSASLFDYLPKDSLIANMSQISDAGEKFWQDIQHRANQYGHDIERPILPAEEIFIPVAEINQQLKQFTRLTIKDQSLQIKDSDYNFNSLQMPDVTIASRQEQPLSKLINFNLQKNKRLLICAESAGRREALLSIFNNAKIFPKQFNNWQQFVEQQDCELGIIVAPIDDGLWIDSLDFIIIAESQLYGQQVMQRRRRKQAAHDQDQSIRDLAELAIGDAIVHIDHGVGRYRGLTHLEVGNSEAEYLILEYAGNDKLYVPVSSLHLISQYSGAQLENAPLHKLGTNQWDKAKQKAQAKAADVAVELLDIYARRQAKIGSAMTVNQENYFQFSSQFPFEETPDQSKAIEAVLADLQAKKSMDRLVCGDVGFGKTEVALRAAFVAIQDGKQVAMLVPTTLLAQQHFETFSDRYADWPIKVEMLSRFRTNREQDIIIKDINAGKVDIIIGTHKLIQQNIKFKNLGLLIIDEEHRFGVKQKEKIKSLRTDVDILTLTATPIPRTLNMALSSIKDLSIIATPPLKRLSIKTFVREYDKRLVQEAILREIMRGGQIYYLHNDIETINKTAQKLQEIAPQAKVAVAHGQMRERQLEQIMSDFYHGRFHILVCTTIIETGIDIPAANTIIIDRADKFGLAQLHQLRGRVGRSHHQAYAYCFTPPVKRMTKDAKKRLEALESLEDLGSGFTLATHDLEIRGAGEILGKDQSGNIECIGFNLYMELLDRAVKALKSGEKVIMGPLRQGAEIDLQIPALIPEDYLPDVSSRLVLYKRIANAKTKPQLEELKVEMIDRFGLLPDAVQNLFRTTEIKIKAMPLGVKKIEASSESGKILFEQNPNVDPDNIIKLIRTQPKNYKLTGSEQIKFNFKMETKEQKFNTVEMILNELTPKSEVVNNP